VYTICGIAPARAYAFFRAKFDGRLACFVIS
jgi:hypothetical protein